LAESLLNNTPSPMSYSSQVAAGLSDEIKDEDKLVANYQLNVKSVKIVPSEDTFQ
jgi:zinc protease